MAELDEGLQASRGVPQVLTFGTPSVGEILAERYQLEEHIGNDSLGRQLYRGIDVILRRPVAVVLRYPGGESAKEMLAAAVAASRIVHPHLVGVYDAIDEGVRAYVVREWVDGIALRDIVAQGPLDAGRSVAIAWAVTDAVASLHGTGMAHGNVHPGTVLVAHDGRVVLTDARADDGATPETDIRAIGAILYCALTGYWPHAEAGSYSVPDGVRDSSGALQSPRQVRAGVPAHLDSLVADLLNGELPLPSAESLAGSSPPSAASTRKTWRPRRAGASTSTPSTPRRRPPCRRSRPGASSPSVSSACSCSRWPARWPRRGCWATRQRRRRPVRARRPMRARRSR
ncbi:protein kinase family protein [Dactylosporangium darangshiense]|uniref:protein kinase family protein n=1 Tax=Dactylosporangium darangshiense TaxID=579108 RepID=UPI00362C490B